VGLLATPAAAAAAAAGSRPTSSNAPAAASAGSAGLDGGKLRFVGSGSAAGPRTLAGPIAVVERRAIELHVVTERAAHGAFSAVRASEDDGKGGSSAAAGGSGAKDPGFGRAIAPSSGVRGATSS
jgi:hypothetical protein